MRMIGLVLAVVTTLAQNSTLPPKNGVMDREWVLKFANDWIDSWNSHDMNRILSHYTEDFEMTSPLIVERLGKTDGVLKGKAAVREYWQPGLIQNPPLRFELIDVLAGVGQATIYYRSVGRKVVAETLFFDASGKVNRAGAQWSLMRSE